MVRRILTPMEHAAKRATALAQLLAEVDETWTDYREPTPVLQLNRRYAKQLDYNGDGIQATFDELRREGRIHILRIPGGKRFVYAHSAWVELTVEEQLNEPLRLARNEPSGRRALASGAYVPGLSVAPTTNPLPKYFTGDRGRPSPEGIAEDTDTRGGPDDAV